MDKQNEIVMRNMPETELLKWANILLEPDFPDMM